MGMENFGKIGHTPHVLYKGPHTNSANEKTQVESMLRILVYDSMIRVIIGKHGSTIKEIIQQTNAW